MAMKLSPRRLSERRGVHKLAHIDPPNPVSLRKSPEQPKINIDYSTKSFLSSSSSSSSTFSAASSTISSSFDFSTIESTFPTPYSDLPSRSFTSSPMLVSTPATSVYQDDWVKPVFPASFSMARSSSKQSLGPPTSRSFAFGRGRHSPAFNSDGSCKFSRLTPSSSNEDLQSKPLLRRQMSFPALMMSYSMPPTPPSRGGSAFEHRRSRSPLDTRPSSHGSSSSNEVQPPRTPVDKAGDLYDPDTLSDPSAPASPAAETSSGRASRRVTVLNKIIPQKLRASMRRRSSASGPQVPPPIPPLSTMPSLPQQAPSPKEDLESYFASKLPSSSSVNEASSSTERIPRTYTKTPELPPLQVPLLSPPESSDHSPLSAAPRSVPDSFVDSPVPTAIIMESVYSPLPAPPVTPIVSPTLPSTPKCATVNSILSLESITSFPHQVVPDVIDPASPAVFSPGHKYTASLPAVPVTADSLADMIERMRMEDHAYAVTERHFEESGWTTKEEIASIRHQRMESKIEWQKKIIASKRALVILRKAEVCGPEMVMDTCTGTLRSSQLF